MRTIFLIRHGMPDFPGGRTMCLGRSELPLSALGRLQGALLGAELEGRGIEAVFSSPLSRCRETAELIGAPVTVQPGLEELFAGDWDGLSFDEIRARWPELYARRALEPSIQPPNAEDPGIGGRRFASAFAALLAQSRGNIAVVAHRTVNRLFLAGLPCLAGAKVPDLPYGSLTRLELEDGVLTAEDIGLLPRPKLDRAVCLRLLEALDTPSDIRDHCLAVSREAMRIVAALAAAGVYPDENSVFAAALLHDIARREKNHAEAGAALLFGLGYGDEALIVKQHHDLQNPAVIDAAAVVFIADKLVSGAERVPLSRRFEQSREKCADAEARAAHDARYGTARAVAADINSICGKDILL
ncbi:MAG: histidine phosphatase family protein [Oscillospiraceae bacterium]